MKLIVTEEVEKLSTKIDQLETLTKKDRKELSTMMTRVKKSAASAVGSKAVKKSAAAAAAAAANQAIVSSDKPAAVAELDKAVVAPEAAVPRKPNQFEKLRAVDEELADFAGWPVGSLHSRVEVTRVINAYVKAQQLQSIATDKRLIVPDEKLRRFLKNYDGETITFPHIQKYYGYHFLPAAGGAAAAANCEDSCSADSCAVAYAP